MIFSQRQLRKSEALIEVVTGKGEEKRTQMADDKNTVNGVASEEDQTLDNFYDLDQRQDDAKLSELKQRVESLEREKQELLSENGEIKNRIGELTVEIEELKGSEAVLKERLEVSEWEIERTTEGSMALESIVARASDLETEVSRLQHDLVTAMNEGGEANAELVQLKSLFREKGERVEALEKEMEELTSTKAESERKVKELERKVGVLEVKELEEKSKKVRVEEEMRDKIDEKEKVVSDFRKKIVELESTIVKNGVELEKWVKEKFSSDELLKDSKEKTKTMELNMMQLQKKLEEAERVISGLMEKTSEAINGTANEVKSAIEGGKNGSNICWPTVVGSTGAIAVAAAMVYLLYRKRTP